MTGALMLHVFTSDCIMSGSKITLLSILHLFICPGSIAQTLVVAPLNTATIQGDSATLECQVEQTDVLTEYISWEECITTGGEGCRRISNDGTIVYSALGGDPAREQRYSIQNPETKTFNLVISDMILTEDAGKYRCIARNDAAEYKDADTVIYQSTPYCTKNTSYEMEEGTFSATTCDVTYAGRWSPAMTFMVDGVPHLGNIIDESVGNTVRQKMVLEITGSNDGDIISIVTAVPAPTDTAEDEASNAPEFEHTYSFSPITVLHGPFNISLSPMETTYRPGDTLTCSADANPTAVYTWKNLNTNTTTSSQLINITQNMIGDQWYQCTASNVYGVDTISIEFTVINTTGAEISTVEPVQPTTIEATSPPTTTSSSPTMSPTTPQIPTPSGAVYTRWGRSECKGQADLIYTGFMGAAGFLQNGSGANFLCVPDDPEWANYMDGDDSLTFGRGTMYGVEYQGSPDELFDHTNLVGSTFVDQNVPCTVCELASHTKVLMIPGRMTCPGDWVVEYWGYLMSEKVESSGRSSYECIDHAPEARNGGSPPSVYTGRIYHVESRCGSMPCPPYINQREITCVICSK